MDSMLHTLSAAIHAKNFFHISYLIVLGPGRFELNFWQVIFKLILVIDGWSEVSLVNLPSDECHWTLLMISQHWFRKWLGAIRQQATTWAIVDPVLCGHMVWLGHNECPGGRFKNNYELLNLRALKFSYVNKIPIFQCMGKIFCVEFQRYPLKFHTKYLTHTLKDMIFMQFWNFKSS